MKKVVFIGGTSYSGSTFLDLMLSNADNGFSCGEVSAFFRPFRSHHLDPKCSCGDPTCCIWEKIGRYGERGVYEGIFKEMPHIDFVVDSSKNPLWIKDQIKNLRDSEVEIINILSWVFP